MMECDIAVTADDIKNGLASSAEYCPIARAVNRKLRSRMSAEVSPNYILLRDRSESHLHNFLTQHESYKISLFIKNFDMQKYVEPFQFKMSMPKSFLKTDGRRHFVCNSA